MLTGLWLWLLFALVIVFTVHLQHEDTEGPRSQVSVAAISFPSCGHAPASLAEASPTMATFSFHASGLFSGLLKAASRPLS